MPERFPSFTHTPGTDSLHVSVGIVGATVMPHAVQLHSAPAGERRPGGDDTKKVRPPRFTRIDVVLALGIAGPVNIAMLAMAARILHPLAQADVIAIHRRT